MNPASIMKLMSAKNKFQKNHPKFVAFLNRCFAGGLKEGTIIEITVTNPGEVPITSNIKVQQSDLELLEELKEWVDSLLRKTTRNNKEDWNVWE